MGGYRIAFDDWNQRQMILLGVGVFQLSTGSGFELWENDGCMMEVIDLTFGFFPIPDQCTSIASNAQYSNCTRIHHET